MPTDLSQHLHLVSGESRASDSLTGSSIRALYALALDDSHDQFASGRPVNWQLVRESCEQLLARSRHLEVGMPYAVALLELEGLPGLVAGLELLAVWLKESWLDVHPRLEEGDEEPLDRIGIIDTLAAPLASYGDRWQVLMRLRRAPLVNSPSHGELLVGSVLARMPGAVMLPDFPVLEPAVLDAALRRVAVQALRDVLALLEAARAHLATIEKAFVDNVPSGRAPNLSALDQELAYLASVVTSALRSADVPQGSSAVRDSRDESGGTKAQWMGGDIRSRDQVLSALESICAYFGAHEPASPLPLLLWRAHRLVKADFLAILEDLVPGALADFKAATGYKEPTARPGS